MRFGNHRYTVDWGHLLVIAMIAVICAAYLRDTLATSTHVNNILFVLPASISALLLSAAIVPQAVRRVAESKVPEPAQKAQAEEDAPSETWRDLGWIALLVIGFGLFVYSLERIGFDVASWLFITLGLFICGERRILALVLYPPITAALLVFAFKALIPYPMFTLIL